jgi:hypothetical protein
MVKGAWIINLDAMRCKNWANGIELGFRLDERGRPVGKFLALPNGLREKIPGALDRLRYLCRMWQRATLVFCRAYRRRLFRLSAAGQTQRAAQHSPQPAPPVLRG